MPDMPDMDAERGLARLLEGYGLPSGGMEYRALLGFVHLLQKWNRRINLTASTAWESLEWLFAEACWARPGYPAGATAHLDIGSGAGFPAIPLRILCPEMSLTLVDSRYRKVAFLATALDTLGLANCRAVAGRIEQHADPPAGRGWDVISWQALKLSTEAVRRLSATSPHGQFWAFHGPGLPFADVAGALKYLRVVETREFPRHARRRLSVLVSRETP